MVADDRRALHLGCGVSRGSGRPRWIALDRVMKLMVLGHGDEAERTLRRLVVTQAVAKQARLLRWREPDDDRLRLMLLELDRRSRGVVIDTRPWVVVVDAAAMAIDTPWRKRSWIRVLQRAGVLGVYVVVLVSPSSDDIPYAIAVKFPFRVASQLTCTRLQRTFGAGGAESLRADELMILDTLSSVPEVCDVSGLWVPECVPWGDWPAVAPPKSSPEERSDLRWHLAIDTLVQHRKTSVADRRAWLSYTWEELVTLMRVADDEGLRYALDRRSREPIPWPLARGRNDAWRLSWGPTRPEWAGGPPAVVAPFGELVVIDRDPQGSEPDFRAGTSSTLEDAMGLVAQVLRQRHDAYVFDDLGVCVYVARGR